ncbi:MarR family winged helix-turn-helix transcriptional regulator [Caldanaerobius polysaccharolyticus]|uniref:MarR family winged helix-turn-helix transcriptional regulator n=1 Tax=Caldanaerobius polysaccharolyticus TaxID=44256 RepID=UPI000691D266|nr:MarR family transcriptional regulator [Caldanaerobius polysaccharolyticus]
MNKLDRDLAAVMAAFYFDNIKYFKHLFKHAVITPSQYKILSNIKKIQPCRMGDLSAISCISFGSLTVMVNKLVEEGFVKRTPCTKDRRIIYVELSEKGEQYLKESAEHFIGLLEDKVRRLDDADKNRLKELLSEANELLRKVWA